MSIAMPLYCTLRSFLVTERERMNDEHGEGVISAAIAVLIIASLGALMWIGFRTIWEISEIGN